MDVGRRTSSCGILHGAALNLSAWQPGTLAPQYHGQDMGVATGAHKIAARRSARCWAGRVTHERTSVFQKSQVTDYSAEKASALAARPARRRPECLADSQPYTIGETENQPLSAVYIVIAFLLQ